MSPAPISDTLARRLEVGLGSSDAATELTRYFVQQGVEDLKDYGAVGDGAAHPLSQTYPTLAAAQAVYPAATALTNEIDWAALKKADAAATAGGEIVVPPGTYRVHVNTTIASAIRFLPGAKLKPASGVTVTLTGAITAGLWQIFDASAGGTISFAGNTTLKAVYPQWWGAVGDGVADGTASINAAIVAAAASAVVLGGQVRVPFPDGTYLTDGILAKSNVWLDFGRAVIKKRSDGTGTSTNSLLRAVETLTGSTYYGTYANIKITGGTLDTNGKTCPAHVVRLVYCDDLVMDDVKVVHSAANVTWAFCLGGRRLALSRLKVSGGTALFQDGVHILHGQYITIDGVYAESGDDALAFGGELADVYLAADPDPIRYVTASNITSKSEKGHAVALYVNSGATGTNWEISDVEVRGVVGTAGVTRNAGIRIEDENDAAYGTTQIRRVKITGVNLKVGSTTHDETNAYGVLVTSAQDIEVAGTIQMTDKTAAATGFRLAQVTRCDLVRLMLNCPALCKRGGPAITVSRDVQLRGTMLGAAGQTTPSVVLVDAEETVVDAKLTNVPSGVDVVSIVSGTLTALDLGRSRLGHAAGASAGVGLATTALLFTHLNVIGVDFTSCFSPFASGSIPSGASFTFAHNKGAATVKKSQATITAGATSIVVTHGAALVTASLSQISVTPDSTWGNATKWWISTVTSTGFTINVDIAPGGSGMTFRWAVDTGRKPV